MTETVVSAKADSFHYPGWDTVGFGLLHLAWSLIFVLAVSCLAHAQPPPIGPASYKSDKQQIAVGVFTGMVKTTVQKIVDSTNETLKNKGTAVRVQALPLKFWSPSRMATQLTNRPNQFYVWLPMIIGINVSIPYASDRQIYIPLDLNVSCDGWQTGNGLIRIDAKAGPAAIEGGNIIEDVLQIRDYITNLVKSNFSSPPPVTLTLSSRCGTIGAFSSQPSDPFAFIAYDPPSPRSIIRGAQAAPRLEVTFLKLKRLRARALNGSILYSATENIVLETYVNYTLRQSSILTLREGDEVAPNMAPTVLNAPLMDSLVVIVNINQQQVGQTQDTAFTASLRSENYSPGVHTLQIDKHYAVPAGPGHTKPSQLRVAAYELTYGVNYANPGVLRQQ